MFRPARTVSFVGVSDLDRALAFYSGTLGFPVRERSAAVAVVDAAGTPLRLTVVSDHVPVGWTVTGWEVADIDAAVAALRGVGAPLREFPRMTGSDGIWTAPGGDRVAWFTDPDGNTLSVTQPAAGRAVAQEIVPIFPVASVPAALARYAALGFTVEDFHGVYGFAARDRVNLHLSRSDHHDPLSSSSMAYLYVDDADALAAEWRAAGVEGRFHDPIDTEYGLREGAYVDPDGNLIRFGSFLR